MSGKVTVAMWAGAMFAMAACLTRLYVESALWTVVIFAVIVAAGVAACKMLSTL